MNKQQTNFTISQETLRKFKQEVPTGKRSQVVNKLLDNYIQKPGQDTSEKQERLQEIENKKIEIQQEIQDLKAQLADLRNEESSLRQAIEQEQKAEMKEQKIANFVGDMVRKFGRSDVRDPETWFSDYGQGNLDKLENVHGVDLELQELRERFLSRIEEDAGDAAE